MNRIARTYYCSGPSRNEWARTLQDLITNEMHDAFASGPDGESWAVAAHFVAETDEYGFRYLHRFKNDYDAQTHFNSAKEALNA